MLNRDSTVASRVARRTATGAGAVVLYSATAHGSGGVVFHATTARLLGSSGQTQKAQYVRACGRWGRNAPFRPHYFRSPCAYGTGKIFCPPRFVPRPLCSSSPLDVTGGVNALPAGRASACACAHPARP